MGRGRHRLIVMVLVVVVLVLVRWWLLMMVLLLLLMMHVVMLVLLLLLQRVMQRLTVRHMMVVVVQLRPIVSCSAIIIKVIKSNVIIIALYSITVIIIVTINIIIISGGQVERDRILVYRPDRFCVLHHVRDVHNVCIIIDITCIVVIHTAINVELAIEAILPPYAGRDRIGGRYCVRHADAVLEVAVVQRIRSEGLGRGEQAQRRIVHLLAEIQVHHVEEWPVASLRLLRQFDRFVLLQQVVPLLDDLRQR